MSDSLEQNGRRKTKIIVGSLGVALVVLVSALLILRLVTGRGLGLRSLPRTVLSLVLAVSNRTTITQTNQGEYNNIIFLHHSTGNNLIEQGNVRELFTNAGYRFWDQSYNYQGLRDAEGNFTHYAYTVPRDNTDPDGLARVFNQKVYSLPINALSGLLQHEVIVVKSCFAPANQISSDDQLEQLKNLYLGMRDRMAQYPDKLFIILTTPPLNPAETNPEQASRARLLADWLKSDEFLSGKSNIFVYDLFDQLAENNPNSPEHNMLRQDYRNGADSHPNLIANQEIAPVIVNSIINIIQTYRSSR
jgi:hypothetical protein